MALSSDSCVRGQRRDARERATSTKCFFDEVNDILSKWKKFFESKQREKEEKKRNRIIKKE